MTKYDDASWHYDGDFPKNLSTENGATHIGFFLTWCIENNLYNYEFYEEIELLDEIEKVKNHELTGRDFLMNFLDEKFTDKGLNDVGNAFAKFYYEDNENGYGDNYAEIFDDIENFYEVENSWENYEKIKQVINKKFQIFLKSIK